MLGMPHQQGTALETGLHQLGVPGMAHYLPIARVVIVPDGCDAVGHLHAGREAEDAGDDEAGTPYALHSLGTGDAP